MRTALCRDTTIPVFIIATTALFAINVTRGLAFDPQRSPRRLHHAAGHAGQKVHASAVPLPPAARPLHPTSGELFRHRRSSSSSIWSSSVGGGSDESSSGAPKATPPPTTPTLRSKIRRVTGFSWTAFRATLRGITGFSLTAVRATLRGLTGISMTGLMRRVLSVFPTWFRYFMQPFLILYYAPLMIIRSWVGPTKTAKAEALAAHEKLVEGWKIAVEVAEGAQSGGYWPVHVDDDGNIVAALPPDPDAVLGQTDINEALLESVEVADSLEKEV